VRVSLLGSTVPIADCISSVTLDRGLYAVTSAMVSVAGILCALAFVSFSAAWRAYALLFASILAMFLVVAAMAIRKSWPVFSGPARVIGKLPWFKHSLRGKHRVIESAEEILLGFYHERRGAFRASLLLNLAAQCMAILEVYLLANFMGVRISLLGALLLEALTKLINLVGLFNPGNVGTYEGGNMIVARLFGVGSAAGLTLALCRRVRALFWASIGALFLIFAQRLTRRHEAPAGAGPGHESTPKRDLDTPPHSGDRIGSPSTAAVIWVKSESDRNAFNGALARVGTLPVLLRTILSVKALPVGRVIVSLDSAEASFIREELCRTGRLPEAVWWHERFSGEGFSLLLRNVASKADHVLLLIGTRTYKPELLQAARDWKKPVGTMVLTTGTENVGIYALSKEAALGCADRCDAGIQTADDLDDLVGLDANVELTEVPGDLWQDLAGPEDKVEAERKLNTWLVKPTDGIFARMNRRISIPISRQLIKYPITPNAVTFGTLAVSIISALLFARGGYWNLVLGAAVSVMASILDGCDGEVARLKLQSSDFGCWLDSICDYIYYLSIFAGIAVGLSASSGTNAYLKWGAVLLGGAVLTFLTVSFMRHRMSRGRPEKFLAEWQKKAEAASSNPLMYIGRYTEFIVRRCFFPYALLAFALLGIMHIAFVTSAISANVAWMIALYSSFTFSKRRESSVILQQSPTAAG
jgi:phosphatidylglycerophosphate synthase